MQNHGWAEIRVHLIRRKTPSCFWVGNMEDGKLRFGAIVAVVGALLLIHEQANFDRSLLRAGSGLSQSHNFALLSSTFRSTVSFGATNWASYNSSEPLIIKLLLISPRKVSAYRSR